MITIFGKFMEKSVLLRKFFEGKFDLIIISVCCKEIFFCIKFYLEG